MSDPRSLFQDHHNWPPTIPGVLPPGVAASESGPAKTSRHKTTSINGTTTTSTTTTSGQPGPATSRAQPPLQEVLKGLDARELEGPSVFDQLFGPLPDGDPRLPKA